jgi:hypothetical protein
MTKTINILEKKKSKQLIIAHVVVLTLGSFISLVHNKSVLLFI